MYGVATQEDTLTLSAAVQMVTPELRSWIQAVIQEDEVKVDEGDDDVLLLLWPTETDESPCSDRGVGGQWWPGPIPPRHSRGLLTRQAVVQLLPA